MGWRPETSKRTRSPKSRATSTLGVTTRSVPPSTITGPMPQSGLTTIRSKERSATSPQAPRICTPGCATRPKAG